MNQEYIDFYHFWGISWKYFSETLSAKNGPLGEVLKIKEEGLIKHLSFSFHSDPSNIFKLVDTGYFETMLCQYNLLDRANEKGIKYAKSKGLGVAIMGPVGGGRLGNPSKVFGTMLGENKRVSTAELALRFVLANPNVTMALSGMSTMQQLEKNLKAAGNDSILSDEESKKVVIALEENRKLADLYCTGCKYCLPCLQKVEIPLIFELVNYKKVYNLQSAAKNGYLELTEGRPWISGKNAEACIECGECEDKCPQKIKIMDQLKEAHELLK